MINLLFQEVYIAFELFPTLEAHITFLVFVHVCDLELFEVEFLVVLTSDTDLYSPLNDSIIDSLNCIIPLYLLVLKIV